MRAIVARISHPRNSNFHSSILATVASAFPGSPQSSSMLASAGVQGKASQCGFTLPARPTPHFSRWSRPVSFIEGSLVSRNAQVYSTADARGLHLPCTKMVLGSHRWLATVPQAWRHSPSATGRRSVRL